MSKPLLRLNWTNFVSVSDPYEQDDFVSSNSEVIQSDLFNPLDYYYFLKGGFLERLLRSLCKKNPQQSLSIIDAGVYMGMFSIATSLICRQNNISHSIQAIEGLPKLVVPAQENFKLYGVNNVLVRNNVVGDQDGKRVRIGARKGGMIGATAFIPEEKAGSDGNVYEVESVSLATLVQELHEDSAIVKLDIEGNEVRAFDSLINANLDKKRIVYIVEFSLNQLNSFVGKVENYGQFILNRFSVFNIGSFNIHDLEVDFWRLSTFSDLENCLSKRKRSHNTDLLLIPLGLDLDF